MKKAKTIELFVLLFFIALFFVFLFVCSILICIHKFIGLPIIEWFWLGFIISCVIAFIGAILKVRSAKRLRETNLSFWIEKNSPKLLLGYVLVVLTIGSINSQPIWAADMVYEILSLQWTIWGLSLTIFLVWNVIIVEFFKSNQPKEPDPSNLFSKYTIAIEKKAYSQKIETAFNTVVLLTINLFLLLLLTTAIYIYAKPENVITQNILLCSFFFTTNSICCLFMDILTPLKKDKEEMLKNNYVTKEDIDNAYAAQFAQAIIEGIKAGVANLDSEKYSDEEKQALVTKYLESLIDSFRVKEDS